MKEIKLTQGYIAKVSDKDYARVSALKWHAVVMRRKDGSIKAVYAVHTAPIARGKQKQYFMHRFILSVTGSSFVDHRDHGGLNNHNVETYARLLAHRTFTMLGVQFLILLDSKACLPCKVVERNHGE